MLHGIVKTLESSFLYRRGLVEIALQCCILSSSSKLTNLFFASMFLTNLTYQSSMNGTLMESYLNIVTNLWYFSFSFFFTNLYGKGDGVLDMGTTFPVTTTSLSVSFLDTSLISTNHFLTNINFHPNNIGGPMVWVPSRVVTVIQCPLFFGLSKVFRI